MAYLSVRQLRARDAEAVRLQSRFISMGSKLQSRAAHCPGFMTGHFSRSVTSRVSGGWCDSEERLALLNLMAVCGCHLVATTRGEMRGFQGILGSAARSEKLREN